jgi:hypothetical protein
VTVDVLKGHRTGRLHLVPIEESTVQDFEHVTELHSSARYTLGDAYSIGDRSGFSHMRSHVITGNIRHWQARTRQVAHLQICQICQMPAAVLRARQTK